jgi:hypothetical protein
MQYLKKFILTSIFAGSCMYGGMPSMPNMTPEQMEAMNSDLSRMTQELEKIDQEIGKMSPEDQAEFFRQVEEVQQVLSTMTPEEMNQLIQEMTEMAPELFADIPQELLYQPVTQPDVLEAPAVQEPTIVVAKELSKEESEFLAIIEGLILEINSFLVKVNSSPEIPGMIERWIQTGKINTFIKEKLEWNVLYKNIELFVVRLSLLKEQDPKNKHYFHLKAALENKPMVEQLNNLYTTLKKEVSLIEVQSFGLHKIDKKTKTAIQNILSSLINQIINQKLINSIDEILKKYEPTAQKLKNAQKAAEQYVRQFVRIMQPQQAVVAGSLSPLGSYQEGELYAPTTGGYIPDSFGGGTPFYSGQPSDYGYGFGGDEFGGGGAAPSDKSRSAEEGTAPEEEGKPGKPERPVSGAEQDKVINEINKLFGEIEEKFNTTYGIFQDSKSLKDIINHLTDPAQNVDVVTAQYIITNLEKRISDLVNNIKIIERKVKSLPEKSRPHFIDQMHDMYNKQRKTDFENFAAQMRQVQEEWPSLESKIAQEKKYAYFKVQEPATSQQKKSEKEAAQAAEETTQIQSSKSLYDLAKAINNLSRAIAEFGRD